MPRRLEFPSYERFGAIRFGAILPSDMIFPVRRYEYLDHEWIGETIAFSHCLRLEVDPEQTRSIAICFEEMSVAQAAQLTKLLGLPLCANLSSEELEERLGPRVETKVFHDQAETLCFDLIEPEYHVECTVNHDSGLTFVTMECRIPPAPDA